MRHEYVEHLQTKSNGKSCLPQVWFSMSKKQASFMCPLVDYRGLLRILNSETKIEGVKYLISNSEYLKLNCRKILLIVHRYLMTGEMKLFSKIDKNRGSGKVMY